MSISEQAEPQRPNQREGLLPRDKFLAEFSGQIHSRKKHATLTPQVMQESYVFVQS